ncbi:MAG TPA: glycosyltransferase family 2 protein [Thermoanaerobaculia bacterium]|nr:glycosyltransferase family 2 protein [Thermoanaerobaculia bacterium]
MIVHYGEAEPTRRAVAAVLADPSPLARRVVVVDNGGALRPEDLPPEVLHLPCPDNPGFGGGANRGVAALSALGGDDGMWLILNHDVEIAPGYLAAEGVGAAAGPLHRDRPGGALWYAGGSLRRLTGTVMQSRSPRDARCERDVGFLPGTALAVRRAAWREVGGFDPRIFLYHEDLDLCLRLGRAGWRLRFVPGMVAVHHIGAATGSGERSAFYLEHLTRTRLVPHRSLPYRLWLAVLHTGWVAWRAAELALVEGRRGRVKARALLRGHRSALAGLWPRR